MAADMKSVKLRMKSIRSTMQITRAMELVASSRLRRARERADASRPYFRILHRTLTDIAAGNTDFSSLYTRENQSKAWCYVVIAGDRGLAGGYNASLFRRTQDEIAKNDSNYAVLPIGKKAAEYYRHRCRLVTEEFSQASSISVSDCFEIADMLCEQFRSGEYGHIALCYTGFLSILSQKPDITSLLPLSDFAKGSDRTSAAPGLILYEPDSETVFNSIVPEYLAGLIYGAVCESVASELAARRTAMDTATKNAGEMMEQLALYYNRARQASITQEITEIVAGARTP